MKIVIVGGGTAGWIAAYFISNSQPNKHDITVIESSKIGIIGAGEGSTGSMIDLLNGYFFNRKISIEEFLNETDGTIKLGIYHQNWTGDSSGYFAPIDCSDTWTSYSDDNFKSALANYGKEKMHLASGLGKLYSQKETTYSAAVHFDGHKVGKFFKRVCSQDGVKHIDAVVSNIDVENDHISFLTLDSGDTITADFFIDCSGLSRILMKKLSVEWHSYKDILPVNTAMPFLLPYDGDTPRPYTSATALSSGWMWEIPLKTRKGCGYVFDKNFLTYEAAQAEVEAYIGKKINPIKFINFESGRNEVCWKNNVLSLGLAASFVEPLEATSIHTTICQLLFFCKEYLHEEKNYTIIKTKIDSYNEQISRLYDLTMDFISFHYQGKRSDTEFWKNIARNEIISKGAKSYLDKAKTQIPGFLSISGMIGSPAVCLWNYIAAGLDIITPKQAQNEILQDKTNQSLIKENSNLLQNKSYITYLK